MARCVLRYASGAGAPEGDLDRIAQDRDVQLVDRGGTGLALAEIPLEALPRVRRLLPGWQVEREREGRLP